MPEKKRNVGTGSAGMTEPERIALIAALQINVMLQIVEVSVCFFKLLLNLGVGT